MLAGKAIADERETEEGRAGQDRAVRTGRVEHSKGKQEMEKVEGR